jgi:hypothetical protein
MPLTPEVAEKLAQEAMERSGDRPKPRMDMGNPDERMRVAEAMLGNTLEALDKAVVSARMAMNFFMGEYAAIRAKGELPKPPTPSPEAMERIAQATRPKTFNNPGQTISHVPPPTQE